MLSRGLQSRVRACFECAECILVVLVDHNLDAVKGDEIICSHVEFSLRGCVNALVVWMVKRRQLDPAIEALVNERLQPNECVLDWAEYRRDEVSVRLIDQELRRFLQDARLRRGGYGRGLSFRRLEGKWVFVGVAGWIS